MACWTATGINPALKKMLDLYILCVFCNIQKDFLTTLNYVSTFLAGAHNKESKDKVKIGFKMSTS